MMGRYAWYVVKDRRYSRTDFKGWKRIVEYRPRETEPLTVIPPDILEHYERNVEMFGYAPMRGLTATQCEVITGLDKGESALRVTINRMGDIAFYKID
jgi:hypothetical protein